MTIAMLALAVALTGSPPAQAVVRPTDPPAPSVDDRARNKAAMVAAAKSFVDTLDAEGRKTALRHFDVSERVTWSYLRGERPGLFLKSMTPDQQAKALALANSALSDAGRTKLARIRLTESVNRRNELGGGAKEATYGDDLYAVLVFGTPGEDPWGFRFEGHHVGLHFSSVSGETTCTPLFFGSFPAALAEGPEKGIRPLGATQDVALELRRSLTAEQAKRASIGDAVPADIITGPGHEKALHDPTVAGGIAMADLAQAQRDQLWGLVLRHALDLRGDLASDEIRRIKEAGLESIRFGFAGEPSLDKPHYYRIVGKTFAIEFDCTQGTPNHVHCVWNDPTRNFGGDILRDHLLREHGGTPSRDAESP